MGWLRRLSTAVRTQVQDWAGAVEDPEVRLDQVIADLQMELIQLRQSVAQAIATQKRTERQQSQHQTWALEWYNRASLALTKGEELRAREALSQRQSYRVLIAKANRYLEQQRQVVAQLKDNMRALEQYIAEAKTRRDLYKARSRSAEVSQRLQTLMAEMGARNTGSVFEDMDARVIDLAAQAEALKELNQMQQPSVTLTAHDADATTASVETELMAMKAQLGQRRLSS